MRTLSVLFKEKFILFQSNKGLKLLRIHKSNISLHINVVINCNLIAGLNFSLKKATDKIALFL